MTAKLYISVTASYLIIFACNCYARWWLKITINGFHLLPSHRKPSLFPERLAMLPLKEKLEDSTIIDQLKAFYPLRFLATRAPSCFSFPGTNRKCLWWLPYHDSQERCSLGQVFIYASITSVSWVISMCPGNPMWEFKWLNVKSFHVLCCYSLKKPYTKYSNIYIHIKMIMQVVTSMVAPCEFWKK